MTRPVLQVEKLGKRFGGFVALQDIDLTINVGERIGLIGPNGSGKSTLVNCLCGTYRDNTGIIRFNGQPINRLAPHQRTRLGIARSFQLPSPFSSLSVIANLRLPLLFAVNVRRKSMLTGAQIEERCADLLCMVGLSGKAKYPPRDLTQVELRKLELARAMATDPSLLIADEAMAGLSHSEIDEILELLFKLSGRGITIILIEHIMRAVMSFSERLVVLVASRKIAEGPPHEVTRNPEVEKAYLGK